MDEQDVKQEGGWTSGRVGPFRLGARHEALGPGLGQLYEAWYLPTGAPVLLLRPGDDVEWRPEGVWRVQLSFLPEWSAVALIVEQAPPLADASELANLLVLSSAAVTRVEDHPQVRTHLATQSTEHAKPSVPLAAWRRPSWREVALVGLALVSMGIGWLGSTRGSGGPCPAFSLPTPEAAAQTDAMILGLLESLGAKAIAYPMPAKPFRNQAVPPCYTKLDEVEINGGCWFAVKRRPPCLEETQAEYKGECLLPSSKDRGHRPAQSSQP